MTSFAYILRCNDGSLYVGKTDRPLADRIADHQAGLGGSYTLHRRPVTAVWARAFERFSDASRAKQVLDGRAAEELELLLTDGAALPEDLPAGAPVAMPGSGPPPVLSKPFPRPLAVDTVPEPASPLRIPKRSMPSAEPADFDLTAYLPYLVNRTGVQLASAFSQEITHHGISLQMWRVLAALHHQDGLRISDLAGVTSIDISTLSRLIGKLEKLDLVARRRTNGSDARVVTVERTAKGRATTGAIVPVAQHYEAVALSGFSHEEARALKAMLNRVHANLDRNRLSSEDLDPAA